MGVLSCSRDINIGPADLLINEFSQPKINYPMDNMPSDERTNLGRYLFYNPVFSIDSSISCSSCHQPALAFSDNTIISLGAKKQIGNRNSPTLTNVGFQPYFTKEGGVESLEIQVLIPIQEHDEFNNNIIDIGNRLKTDPVFVTLAQKAYPNKPYYYAITRGLSAFERTFVSNQSKFDFFLQGASQLSESETNGLTLFMGNKANCIQCHSGFNFSNYQFENNGASYLLKDSGRYRLTKNVNDIGLFKVPTLRNIELTGPYMHDGSIASLSDVLLAYNEGGTKNTYRNEQWIKPLKLTSQELKDLELFLRTLTDYSFTNNTNFTNYDY